MGYDQVTWYHISKCSALCLRFLMGFAGEIELPFVYRFRFSPL
jgi:hypothetical protein